MVINMKFPKIFNTIYAIGALAFAALLFVACGSPIPEDSTAEDIRRSLMADDEILRDIGVALGAPVKLPEDFDMAIMSWRGVVVEIALADRNSFLHFDSGYFAFVRETSEMGWTLLAISDWAGNILYVPQPFAPRGASQVINNGEALTMRIYSYEPQRPGYGEDLIYREIEICGENWSREVIDLMHEHSVFSIVDLWLEDNRLVVELSPIHIINTFYDTLYNIGVWTGILFNSLASLPDVEEIEIIARGDRGLYVVGDGWIRSDGLR
ncbi:MAG: hypothetical protein FWC76_08790 [Defluviitaleaceae bacterium]|nr:hypothetical protein [Defluviitaleaceae bacterium]